MADGSGNLRAEGEFERALVRLQSHAETLNASRSAATSGRRAGRARAYGFSRSVLLFLAAHAVFIALALLVTAVSIR